MIVRHRTVSSVSDRSRQAPFSPCAVFVRSRHYSSFIVGVCICSHLLAIGRRLSSIVAVERTGITSYVSPPPKHLLLISLSPPKSPPPHMSLDPSLCHSFIQSFLYSPTQSLSLTLSLSLSVSSLSSLSSLIVVYRRLSSFIVAYRRLSSVLVVARRFLSAFARFRFAPYFITVWAGGARL